MLNRIPTFSLKAMNAGDDVYVDEQGRHVIFRTINGQVVPIRTDSNGYASWLKKQGVEIDPADQKTLDQLDRQLEIFDMARERGGPELQQQYQQAFEKDLKKRQQLVRQYYQQALQNQAATQETTVEKLQQAKEKRYQEHKEKEVSRSELEDRGWSSYIKSYTKQITDAYNATPDTKTFYLIHAFDTILMKGLSLAQEGVPLSNINVADLVSSELRNPKTFERLFPTRYKEIAEQENFDENAFLSNFYPSMESLDKIFRDNGDTAKDLTAAFNAVYNRALQDFHPEEEDRFTDLQTGFSDALGLEEIPENLPPSFGSKEAQALMGVYNKKSSISPLKSAHEVTLHTLSRLFEGIPQNEKVSAAVALADDQSGLNAIHKDGFRTSYKEKNGFGMDVSSSDAIETILREAAKAQSGTTTDKINAMKKIAHALGRIDGAALIRQDDRGYKSHIARWSQSSIRAGRSKADGPGLIDAVLDEDSRAANILPNSVLRIPDTGEKPAEKPDLSEVPQQETSELRENEVHPGFFSNEGRIVSEDGYGIEITGKRWDVYSPENEIIGSVNITPAQDSDNIERTKQKAFSEVKEVIAGYEQNQKEIQEAQENNTPAFSTPGFDFNAELTESEQSILSNVDLNRFNVSSIIPGAVYRVSEGEQSLDLVYTQGRLAFGVRDESGNLSLENASQDFFDSFFTPEKTDSPEENDEPTTEEEDEGIDTEEDLIEEDEDTQEEESEPVDAPQIRRASTQDEINQSNTNVMAWRVGEDEFKQLLENFDYEKEGIFWNYNEDTQEYDISMPQSVRGEFFGIINRSINSLPNFKL